MHLNKNWILTGIDMVTNKNITSFDDITEDNRLWAVRYEGDEDNILDILFAQMQEREHTLQELLRQEQVRNFLLTNQIIDTDSFIDYLTELK
ncbi:MAG: hypothetical protein J6S93_00310 [Paludibacteraceae bacterium]|nr:hypothetical protein [Paludibacteraceae bacterium]